MAYDDALFQLGMDLTRSSTAQKEDHGDNARLASEDRKDFFIERDGVRFAGTHLIIDLFGARRLDDLEYIERTLRRCVDDLATIEKALLRAVAAAGATLLHIHLHHFTPNGGVSGVAVLAESHISIHSWPEADYAAFDVFMCGNTNPHACVEVLRRAFGASLVEVQEHRRGEAVERRRRSAAPTLKRAVRAAKPKVKVAA
jgi:S-adenosylmethionine decarboxylase